jgi:hypothetical protein
MVQHANESRLPLKELFLTMVEEQLEVILPPLRGPAVLGKLAVPRA